MDEKDRITVETPDVDRELLQALDRAFDDIENGRVLPLESAMKKVDEIRRERKKLRA